MKVAFTGTRVGMTKLQRTTVAMLLRGFSLFEIEAHHSDCVGADADFHALCTEADVFLIVVHPPEKATHRAFCENAPRQIVLPPKPYLDCNRDIVHRADILIATPRQAERPSKPATPRGSGTWWTINYAEKIVPTVIVWPDGGTDG